MLLILDNNWARWTNMTRKGGKTSILPRYTQRGKDAKKYCGWSNEGMKKYNLFMKYVSRNRKEDDAKEVEHRYVRHRMRLSRHAVAPEDDDLDGKERHDANRVEVVTDLFGENEKESEENDNINDEMEEWLEELEIEGNDGELVVNKDDDQQEHLSGEEEVDEDEESGENSGDDDEANKEGDVQEKKTDEEMDEHTIERTQKKHGQQQDVHVTLRKRPRKKDVH